MNLNTLRWLMPLAAYLIGSIPIGWIVGKVFYHKDIRKEGSGNVGATNALRSFGSGTGIMVLILDMAKGFVPTLVAIKLLPAGSPFVALCTLLVIIGHVFPIFLGFKGGKGVATAGGAFLALAPLSLLVALGTFIIVVVITRYVSLGSIIAAVVFLLHALWRLMRSGNSDYASLVLITVVVLMIVLRHRSNLQRLLNNEEHKIQFTRKGHNS